MKLRPLPVLLPTLLAVLLIAPWAAGAVALPETTPNGLLLDRVAPLAHLEELDGTPEAPATTLGRWRQALHELQRAAEGDLGWPAPRALQKSSLAAGDDHQVALALIHARYDRLDGAGATVPAEVLALGALRDRLYQGADVSYTLDPARVFSHRTAPIAALAFDPDDGGGARPLTAGKPVAVSYGATGRKTLTLTVRLADGRELTARTTVTVKRLVTPDPTATWAITAGEAYQGVAAGGQAYLYLAPGHATLTNPVVVVEGFDLDNSMDWPVLYDTLNQQNMLEELRVAGYDAVVLDFTEATHPIQRNAFVLTELLAQVNAATPAGRTSVVIGASMGGLVSRYALLWLENAAIDHQVRTWLSFDSPHLGANIPLGLQHWLEFFQGESTDAAFLLSRLDTPAARQMLLYHHLATSGTSAGADPQRASWLADVAGLGDWPAVPRRVAVANGSGTVQDQGFPAGDQVILYEYRSLLVDIDGDVWAVPDGGAPRVIFDGGMNLIWPLPDTYRTVSVGGTVPWDGAPGGFRGSMAQMDATPAPYGDIIALHDNHCFIPTVSSLALAGVGPFHDVAADPDLMSRTPFDAVHFPVANQEHIAITAENKQWFLAEIQAGISDVPGEVVAAAEPMLHQAVPNPFNPRTAITFELPRADRVALAVYDVRGRHVRDLVTGVRPAGRQTVFWNGDDATGRGLASGVYFVALRSGEATAVQRVMLVR